MPNWNLIHQESKCEDYSDHVCLLSKLLLTQINATLNSLVYKISATYYNLSKETIFGGYIRT